MTYADAPTDSTDARERREAEAAAEAAEVLERRRHAEQCHDGWLGEDETGRPVACPRCRPHLTRVACWTCGQRPAACAMKRNTRLGPCCDHCNHRPAARPDNPHERNP